MLSSGKMKYYLCIVLVAVPEEEYKDWSESSEETIYLSDIVNHDHFEATREVSLINHQDVDEKYYNQHVYDIFDEFGGI